MSKHRFFTTYTTFFYLIILIVVGIILNSCSKEKTNPTYMIVKSEGKEVLADSSKNYKIFADDNLISFFEDKKFAVLTQGGVYLDGRWNMEGDKLTIKYKENQKFIFKKDLLEGGFVKLTELNSPNPLRLMVRVESDFAYKNIDLLRPEINKWRKKPAQKENQEQLEKRIIAQLNYLIEYFNIVENKNLKSFSTQYHNAPFNFYNRGIGIKTIDEQNHTWIDMFYDSEDAMKSLEILNKAMRGLDKYPDEDTHTKAYKKTIEMMKVLIQN